MNKKILIVEDDVVFCRLLTKFLSRNNFEVMDAQNGRDAFELMEMNEFKLAILDYRLPDMTGLEILEKLKSKSPGSKIILITRYGDQDIANQAIEKGADAFISKPINPNELLEVINKL
ncbi:Response regulator receiver domain-containing protein [Belliella buryatensis]|uniref:Response regulator receiver domain-containing protein n=1 Tax=Belliella buryatensis TaxID=1500549 RepID=A0A239AIA7_9BACT|nr:response regulator [Belliella buryatensis]SNR95269.1 Response regulator receiver domain-containing protein [Belliella buryatensis]